MSAEEKHFGSPVKTLAWLVAIMAATAGLSLISIHIPFGRDQGVAAYFGWQILQGKAVYRDLYHFNFPGIFWTYAAALKIFGARVEAINQFDLIFRIFTLLGVFLAAGRMFSSRTGLWATGIYGIISTVVYNNYWLNAQKETFALGALAYCLYFMARGSGGGIKKSWLFLAGVFAFGAMLYKPTVALAPGLAILSVVFQKENSARDRAFGFFSFVIGAMVLAAGAMLYLYSKGSLADMARQVFIFGVSYGGQYYAGGVRVLGLVAWKIASWAVDFGFLLACGVAGAIASVRKGQKGFKLNFWFGLGLFLNILVQLKFFVYHFMVMLLPLSIFAGAFFGEHLKDLFPPQIKGARAAVWLLAALLLVANLQTDLGRYPRELLFDAGKISREDFLERYGKWGVGDISALASYKVARYLREQTSESDKVLVFSIEPGLNFLSRRAAPTRFCYDLPLDYSFGGPKFKIYQERLRKEFISELRADPPAYIVVLEKDTNTVEPRDSFSQMLEFVEFHGFIEQNYYLETKIEHYYLYRRK